MLPNPHIYTKLVRGISVLSRWGRGNRLLVNKKMLRHYPYLTSTKKLSLATLTGS